MGISTKQTGIPFTKVKVTDKFWAPKMETNRLKTIPANEKQCRETGRLDCFKPGYKGERHYFWDSDVAKWIEAGCYSLAVKYDKKLEKTLEDVISDIIAMQQPDGYMNNYFIYVKPEMRWKNLRDCHELYCAGHLIEAAVAHFYATGRRNFLDAMCRYADLICKTFGPEKGQIPGYPGHQEIELALVKLYHATNEERYLKMACFFIDQRGQQPHYYDKEAIERGDDPKKWWAKTYEYCQAHLPVREQKDAVGHSVRALYMYSGMADCAKETGDKELEAACKRLWESVCERQMYITGGIGPSLSNEGFVRDYMLPVENISSESCASIAAIFFCQRMLYLTGESKYADAMERIMYNSGLSGVSLDGEKFFYSNQLYTYDPEADKKGEKKPESKHYQWDGAALHRQGWYGCSCCPPNIARFIASLPGYIYGTSEKTLWVNLFVGSETEFEVDGVKVKVAQKTKYPWNGKTTITFKPEKECNFTVKLRMPAWCQSSSLKVKSRYDEETPVDDEDGYLTVTRKWRKGDHIIYVMDMPVQRVYATTKVRELEGRVAIQRGPVVYCLETVDNCTNNLERMALPRKYNLRTFWDKNLLGGVMTIIGKVEVNNDGNEEEGLYQQTPPDVSITQFKAVPYYAWDNRAPGSVIVWIREK